MKLLLKTPTVTSLREDASHVPLQESKTSSLGPITAPERPRTSYDALKPRPHTIIMLIL